MQNNEPIKMVILDDYQNFFKKKQLHLRLPPFIQLSILNEHVNNEKDFIEKVRDYQIIVGIRERTPFPKAILDNLPNLKLLITTGSRNASFDLDAATLNNIVVSGTSGSGEGPVDLTWGLIISLLRGIHTEDKLTRDGRWGTVVGPSLNGKTLGLLGLGHIGKLVAKVGIAFGMNVIAWSQNLTQQIAKQHGVKFVDKQTLCSESDILSIHSKLSDRTRGIIGSKEIALMKTSSYIINTSRGPIIEESALINALNQKKISGAAIDTFDIEPLPTNHPLLKTPNTLITPHIGYVTEEAYEAYIEGIIENISAFFNHNPKRVLNPEVLKVFFSK
jgi:phosphoglycerate dehydrogenase-like enzyme